MGESLALAVLSDAAVLLLAAADATALMDRVYRARGVILFNQGTYERAVPDLDRD
jgi:hypothetical protein